MINFIKMIIKAGLRRKGSLLVSVYMGLLLISSLLITAVEPQNSALTHFDQALWWSIVTSTTVGYGDIYPVTGLGRIVAVVLPMFMGIGLGAAFITHVASRLIERRDSKMHGETAYTGTHHILLVGFTDETKYLVQQIQRDETYAEQDIILLADISRHPFPERDNLFFVKGRPDTLDALEKANTHQASRIIIHTGSDEESLFALINTLKLKKPSCEITVRCLSTQSLDTFSSVPGKFEIIMQMTAEMMVQAMQDKVHIPLQTLLRNDADDEIYYVTIPEMAEGWTWWKLHRYLMETYGYLSFAMKTPAGDVRVNPGMEEPVPNGCGIWLMADRRPLGLTWPEK